MEPSNETIKQGATFELTAHEEHRGQRIDKFITNHFSQYSRSFLQKLFNQKHVLINKSKTAKPGNSLKPGDQISISFPEQSSNTSSKTIPNNMNIEIISKEKDFLILNKPSGLVVHPPNETCQDATLTDWLIQKYDDIEHVGLVDRPGIVHRLDRDTSGLMIIARTNAAHAKFTQMFKNRNIQKTYLTIVIGHPPKEGIIDYFIGRHPSVRNKMHHFTQITKLSSSREAISHYKVLNYYKNVSLVEVKPVTGRTHQIRVHMAAIGYPVLSDLLYGKQSKLLKRHALHAHKLEFEFDGKQYKFTCPLSSDLENLLSQNNPITNY